jgi:hypothetical protein
MSQGDYENRRTKTRAVQKVLIVLFLFFAIVAALLWIANHASGQTVPGVCYAPKCRSTTQRDRFMRLTGFDPRKGRSGWIINHMRPLRCHGADLPSNMVWMDSASAKAQDRWEGDCARYIPFDTTQLDSTGRAVIR